MSENALNVVAAAAPASAPTIKPAQQTASAAAAATAAKRPPVRRGITSLRRAATTGGQPVATAAAAAAAAAAERAAVRAARRAQDSDSSSGSADDSSSSGGSSDASDDDAAARVSMTQKTGDDGEHGAATTAVQRRAPTAQASAAAAAAAAAAAVAREVDDADATAVHVGRSSRAPKQPSAAASTAATADDATEVSVQVRKARASATAPAAAAPARPDVLSAPAAAESDTAVHITGRRAASAASVASVSSTAVRRAPTQTDNSGATDVVVRSAASSSSTAVHKPRVAAAPVPAASAAAAPPSVAAVPPPSTAPSGRQRSCMLVNGVLYEKLELIGRGGSSKVYKVLTCDRSRTMYALKRVHADDSDTLRMFLEEIEHLEHLRGEPCIIQLVDREVLTDGTVHIVLEYGETDLNALIKRSQQPEAQGGDAPPPGALLSLNATRFYFEQMLWAVRAIHARKIVHADLKPANFMLVGGTLKLIDFGIAKRLRSDATSVERESQVGTLNYMAPEAFAHSADHMKIGTASDVWSLGCILYQLVYGQPPFAQYSLVQKLQFIPNPHHEIAFPPTAFGEACVDLMRACLQRDRRSRPTIDALLAHPFLAGADVGASADSASGADAQSLPAQLCEVPLVRELLVLGQRIGQATKDADAVAESTAADLWERMSAAGGDWRQCVRDAGVRLATGNRGSAPAVVAAAVAAVAAPAASVPAPGVFVITAADVQRAMAGLRHRDSHTGDSVGSAGDRRASSSSTLSGGSANGSAQATSTTLTAGTTTGGTSGKPMSMYEKLVRQMQRRRRQVEHGDDTVV